jgi:hypothetical protein
MCRYLGVIIGFMIFLAGCSPAQQDDVDSSVAKILADNQTLVAATEMEAVQDIVPTVIEETPDMDASAEAPAGNEAGLEPLISLAVADLAERLSIATTEITLVSAEAVVWPDASLGCPQPDMLYRQVPVDGALIILQAGEREYAYHSGGSREPFLCEQEEPQKHPQIKPTKGIYHPPDPLR